MRITSLIFFATFIISIRCRIDLERFIHSLSPTDKCGQMTQISLGLFLKYSSISNNGSSKSWRSHFEIDQAKLLHALQEKKIGSILWTPESFSAVTWQKWIRLIQDVALNQTHLKIPILYGIDSIHGASFVNEATLFPQPLSLAATFNEKIVRRVGELTALETRAVGIPWNFNPVLDVGRQPLWSRFINIYTIF